jgi:molybdopterin synthase sulfur carrier subunit
MRLLYFAWLRARVGLAEEEVAPPSEVRDVRGLIEWLKGRGANYAEALKELKTVRVAVNQEYVGLDHPLRAGDEVALFPPVTGG